MQIDDGCPTPKIQRQIPYFLALFIFFFSLLIIKKFAIYGGWAENDANRFHFIIINYFIHNGFDWQYPQLLPMYPGMHVFFAAIARFSQIDTLSPSDWASFAVQTVWGSVYLGAALAIALRLKANAPNAAVPAILLILLCSSYPVASWIWPTTELGAFAMMYGMYALTIGRAPLSLTQACIYAIFAVIATLFRQNYAIFAVTPAVAYLIQCLGGVEKIRAGSLFNATIPIIAAGLIVIGFTLRWGGLVPPELARHGGAGHIEIAQIQNMIALIGLIGLPFVALSIRMLANDRMALVSILALSLGLALASEFFAPMIYDHSSGHWGSLAWTIILWEDARHLYAIPLMIVSAAGWFVCLAILYRSVEERYLAPEIIMLGLLAISLLPQIYVYQRYSEVTILASLAIFFLPRVELRGIMRWFVYIWYSAYMVVSLIRPLIALGSLSG